MSAPSEKKRVSVKKKEEESKRVVKEKASKPTSAPPSAVVEARHGGRMMQRQARGYSLGEVTQAGLNFGPGTRGGPLVDGRRRSGLEGNVPSPEGSNVQTLSEVAGPTASQPQPSKVPEEGLPENAEPTMINVRSEGLKLDLVLLQNKVSGLAIDYQGISKSGELQRWLRIIDGMLSDSAPSPEGSNVQTLSEVAGPTASQPQPSKEEQEVPLKEKEEQEEPPREIDYRKIVLRAVDVGLDTLGNDQKHAVLTLLEDEYGFRENDIPDHPRGFVEVLDELLGPSARAVEREIISNIRLVWATPGENLETVMKSLKEQTCEPSSTTGNELSKTTGS
ncbi:MAG: hypothetical protein ABSB29_07615 [Nitrososphaerales archaeon]